MNPEMTWAEKNIAPLLEKIEPAHCQVQDLTLMGGADAPLLLGAVAANALPFGLALLTVNKFVAQKARRSAPETPKKQIGAAWR